MLVRGQLIRRKGIKLGNLWEDCPPHSTQPMRNCGRDLHTRE